MKAKNKVKVVYKTLAVAAMLAASAISAAQEQGLFITEPEQIWAFESAGPIYGDVAIGESTAYFASVDGSAYALDRETGYPLWQYETEGPIYSDTVLGEHALYFQSDDGYSYSIDQYSGQLNWRSYTGNEGERDAIFGGNDWDYKSSAPVELGEFVYVASASGEIYGLDKNSGMPLWVFDSGAKFRAKPLVTEELVIAGNFDGFIYALDRFDGSVVWTYDTHDEVDGPERIYIINSPATLDGETVYIGSRNTQLYALDVNTGAVKWSFLYDGSWVESPLTVADGVVYAGSSFYRSQFAFDAAGGELLWQSSRIAGLSYAGFAVRDEHVFTGTIAVPGLIFDGFLSEGGLLKLARDDGDEVWFYPFEQENPYLNSFGVVSTPIVDGTEIYVGSLDGKLHRIDEITTEYPILTFSADRDELKYKEHTVLRWHVIDHHEVRLNGHRVPNKGFRVIKGRHDKTYTLSVNGRLVQQASIDVVVKPAEEINLAQFGSAVASSSENDAALGPQFAIDSNLNTRWSSEFNDGETLTVDLENEFPIERVVIHWEGAYAEHFTLEASEDGVSWQQIYENTANEGGISDISGLDAHARYIRMTSVTRATPWGTSIYEIEVYEPAQDELERKNCKKRKRGKKSFSWTSYLH